MEIVYDEASSAPLHRRRPPRSAPTARSWSTASSTTPSRSTSTRSTTARSSTSAASWSTSRRPASTPATRPACCRPITLGGRRHQAAARLHRGHRQGRRRARPDQHPVRAGRRHPLRARGQPARVPHRALHLEGDRRAAGQGRGPASARRDHRRAARRGHAAGHGDGGTCRWTRRSPSRRPCCRSAVPHHRRHRRRHHARPGDALHRRGHGHRLDFGTAFAKSPGRGVRRAAHRRATSSSRSPTATSAR